MERSLWRTLSAVARARAAARENGQLLWRRGERGFYNHRKPEVRGRGRHKGMTVFKFKALWRRPLKDRDM